MKKNYVNPKITIITLQSEPACIPSSDPTGQTDPWLIQQCYWEEEEE